MLKLSSYRISAFLQDVLVNNAKRAARRIVNACVRGKAEVTLSQPAKIALKSHGSFPGLTTDLLGLTNVLLPPPVIARNVRIGKQNSSSVSPSWIITLTNRCR